MHFIFEGTLISRVVALHHCRAACELPDSKYNSTVQGVEFTVRGDGNLYKVLLRTADCNRSTSFQADFQTSKDCVSSHTILFCDFRLKCRGKPVPKPPPIKNITSIGFMLSLKTTKGDDNPMIRNGPFSLDIFDFAFI